MGKNTMSENINISVREAKSLHFTLIELLVVIAIIAILAAILLPALNSARERGRSAACVNNLKQQATALNFYADASSDYLPPAWSGVTEIAPVCGTYTGFWCDILARAGYFPGWEEVAGSGDSAVAQRNAKGPTAILICASDPDPYLLIHTYKIYTSYGMNDRYALSRASWCKRVRIKNISTAPMTGDSWGDPTGTVSHSYRGRISSGNLQAGNYPAHGYINATFFDGHVDAIRDKKYKFDLE